MGINVSLTKFVSIAFFSFSLHKSFQSNSNVCCYQTDEPTLTTILTILFFILFSLYFPCPLNLNGPHAKATHWNTDLFFGCTNNSFKRIYGTHQFSLKYNQVHEWCRTVMKVLGFYGLWLGSSMWGLLVYFNTAVYITHLLFGPLCWCLSRISFINLFCGPQSTSGASQQSSLAAFS